MKKILFLALTALMVAISCVGCAPEEVGTPDIDSPLPWFAYRNFESESVAYNVTKNFMIDENNLITVNDTDNSFLTYTLTQHTDETNSTICTLETSFKIKYTNNEYISQEYHGKTDTITSTVVFRADNFSAISSAKTVSLESAPDKSYSYNVNYSQGIASFVVNSNQSQITFSKGNYVDNEFLYYYVRSMKNLGSTLNETFSVVNWYECYLKGEFFSTQMIASYYSVDSVKLGDSSLLSGFDAENKDTEANTVTCNLVQIWLNGTKKGAPLYAYYTKSPYQIEAGKQSKKLLAAVRTYENTLNGTVTYRTDFTLKSFDATFKTAA